MQIKTLIVCTLAIWFSSCSKDDELIIDRTLKTGDVFFDKPDQKQWRHKVNTVEGLQLYTNSFGGIEFDLVYDSLTHTLQVEHDPTPKSTIFLHEYWGEIISPELYYYWLDIKNLKESNVDDIFSILDSTVLKYQLKENIICESRNPKALSVLGERGYYTSYWFTNFYYEGINDAYAKKVKREVEDAFELHKFNAISCHSDMLGFVNDFLPYYTVHVWTNGLIGDEDKKTIRKIEEHPYVKVILTDYEEPF